MRKSLVSILFCSITVISVAQIPVQILGGHEATEYNFMWDGDLDSAGRVNLFNFTFFNLDYESPDNHAYEIYQVATYNFTNNWGLAGGGRFTMGRFSPQMAMSFQIFTKDLYLNLFPTLQYLPATERLGYSMFGILIYQPQINDRWNIFSQITLEPLFDNEGHIYSYQQLRFGLGYRNLFQFGLGANLEQIGRNFQSNENYGLFIRKEF